MGTDILFERPSFLSGMARTLDLWGSYTDYNVSAGPEEADALAMLADWRAVGNDLFSAIQRVQNDPQQLTLFSEG